MGHESWTSVEDYLPAGNGLGYNGNWRIAHSGGELLMMGQTGEPYGYYPMDSNGLSVQTELPAPCACVVQPQAPEACSPLGYGGCVNEPCAEPNGDPQLLALGILICQWWGWIRPCTPSEWNICRKRCRSKGGIAIGCMHFTPFPSGSPRIDCWCQYECTPNQWNACIRDCAARGKIATGCRIIEYPNGHRERKCECVP